MEKPNNERGSNQGHREFPFGKLKIPPPLLHKIPENSRWSHNVL